MKAPSPRVRVAAGYGWSEYRHAAASIFLTGYIFDGSVTHSGETAAHHLIARLATATNETSLSAVLRGLGGHFAFVFVRGDRIIASVDRIASSPVFFGERDGHVVIGNRGAAMRAELGLDATAILSEQALSIAMSGWTVGATTLYRGLRQLRAGEALVADPGGCRRVRWFVYDAWRIEDRRHPERELSDLHRFLIERLVANADGRQICVPLSAGLDSRMIASGLREVGYRNVRLFAYGRPGNHEATASARIAEKLGYPWTFIPFRDPDWRAAFRDANHNLVWTDLDDCASVPFEQDWIAIRALLDRGGIDRDALVVNGQSGDYLTGNHIPAEWCGESGSSPVDWPGFVLRYARKHAALWSALMTEANLATLGSLWRAELADAGYDLAAMANPHGAFEFLEYQDRQSKYVVSGQRTYDVLGFDWRLPLWDDELIDFWRHMPLRHKAGQNLYRRVLEQDNWGGVWQGASYPRYITPRWLVPARLVLKAAFLPAGKSAWHRFERHFLQPIMDPLRTSAVLPYLQQVSDRRGAKHIVAWLAERYLRQHGIELPTGSCH